jgi:hypothetical protein
MGNVERTWDSAKILELFKECGYEAEQAEQPANPPPSGNSYAFISFPNPDKAAECKMALNGQRMPDVIISPRLSLNPPSISQPNEIVRAGIRLV